MILFLSPNNSGNAGLPSSGPGRREARPPLGLTGGLESGDRLSTARQAQPQMRLAGIVSLKIFLPRSGGRLVSSKPNQSARLPYIPQSPVGVENRWVWEGNGSMRETFNSRPWQRAPVNGADLA